MKDLCFLEIRVEVEIFDLFGVCFLESLMIESLSAKQSGQLPPKFLASDCYNSEVFVLEE
jgi:hypothetical protein